MQTGLAYPFTAAHSRSAEELTALLGGKGASLAAMTAAGFPVPPGFTITTEACRAFLADGWTDGLEQAIRSGIEELQVASGKELGSSTSPLLVSVRSGAEISMPGMMDTALNVGMNPDVERALADLSQNPQFARDTHVRALLGFAEIVLQAPADLVARLKADPAAGPAQIRSDLAEIGLVIPADPMTQITDAVRAVFESWRSPRAVSYRDVEGIDGSLGTAVTVQCMVFGNLGERSGTGVAFTRNPTSGNAGLMGDFLADAQGEDVVAGSTVTLSLDEMASRWPGLYADLERIADLLEQRYQDMVDLEFTVEDGSLWMLQARRGKRSPIAAFRIAIDLADDDRFAVDRAEAVARCRRYFEDPPLAAASTDDDDHPTIAAGLAASPGIASGRLCLDPDRAVELRDQGVDVILARRETSPADVHGMAAAKGLFTTLGGQVSHAALVAREWGLPAVVGASEAEIVDGAVVGPGGRVPEGEIVTVDGVGGRLLRGHLTVDGTVAPEVAVVTAWAAEIEQSSTGHDAEDSRDTSAVGDPAATMTAGAGVSADGGEAAAGTGVDLGFHAFHALRIKGMVTATSVAAICGCAEDRVVPVLDELTAVGHATFMEPRGMWLITAEGRVAHQPILAAMVDGVETDDLPYREFLALNDEFKQLCTDWQLRDGEPNDHQDEAYDGVVVERLCDLDDRAQPILARIAMVVAWTKTYGPRLADARRRLLGGDQKALTGVMCDSYHDVWMELHEDLILTQGIDRAEEGST